MDRLSNNSGLHFDELQRPLPLHLILSTRSGSFIREIPIDDVRFHETLTNGSEISFSVYKKKCLDKNKAVDVRFWQKIKDLKLTYCKELDRFYELRVNLDESDDTVKSVTAISLGEAEASQCNLYGIEINTEADIARDDYKPSVLYDEENKDSSIVDRLISKMPHYRIGEVDSSIRNIQRTFRFDGKSVYDACQEVGKEIGCLFQFECRRGDNHKIVRTVHVRDMLCTCDEPGCGARGDFTEICEKCGSTNISRGYGEDTSIYISRDNLAENIEYEADVDSVKNCFRLAGGDDLMTAAIIAQNPNGTQYLWYITDEMREDMSDELRERLAAYDDKYAYYQNEYQVPASMSSKIESYNTLVAKYTPYNNDLRVIAGKDGEAANTIVGYPAIMEAYYNTIDLELYLRSGLMPNVVIATTNADAEAEKLTSAKLSPAAVSDLEACTATTAANAVLGMARCLVRASFSVKVKSGSYNTSTHQWTGILTVKNYSDEEDTADSQTITVTINDDLEKYIRQKIDTTISKDKDDPTDIVDLFALGDTAFNRELKKYSLKKLEEFRSACQVCMDVMIQHGVNRNSLSEQLSGAYDNIYLPYRDKMAAIESEIRTRSEEIEIVSARRDENGNVIEDGLQSMLERIIGEVHGKVDFETFVGSELMEEFASYRRDDSYENPNYISDGLDNKALFQRAAEFMTAAKYEIARAARVHHSIKATLSNLLQMKEFLPIIDDFRVGNKLRVEVDDKLYVLRLTEFEVDYETFGLSVVFSDVMDIGSPEGDIAQILGNARSISTTYNAVMHQAEAGKKSSDVLSNIAQNGLKLTTHIVGGAHNQEFLLDESGYLGRTYIPETDSYSPEQIRIISNGIYITDDDWETMKAALGKFQYYDPEAEGDDKVRTGFGVIADQLVGNMLLTNSAGIYNKNGSVVINDQGMKIVVDAESENPNNFSIVRNNNGIEETLLGVDNNGNLVIQGKIGALTGEIGGFTIGDSALYNGGKSTIDASNNGVYLGADGISLGNSVFKVTKQGFLTSTSGTIGGFTIGSTSLKNTNSSNTVGLNAPASPGKDEIAIWAGSNTANISSPFYVTYGGHVTVNDIEVTGGSIKLGEGPNSTPIFNVEADGTATVADLIINGGEISLGNGAFSVSRTGVVDASSLNLKGGTISLGKDNNNNPIFDVDTDGHVTAKNLDITGGSIYIRDGNKDTFSVTNKGKVTASDMNITGGSISIKNGNNVVFNVDENGNAYFSGQVDVGQLVGYAKSSELESFNDVLQHAVDYGTLEAALSQTYADVNTAIQNAVGYAIDYNAINAAIKQAIKDATSYINATKNNTADYPDYFTAKWIVAKNMFSGDSYYVDNGLDDGSAKYDLVGHYHNIIADDETGRVTIGGPIAGNGTAPFFNIADTKFFRDAVSAAGGGISIDNIIITDTKQIEETAVNAGIRMTTNKNIEYDTDHDRLVGYAEIEFGVGEKKKKLPVKIEMSASNKSSSGSVSKLDITSATAYSGTSIRDEGSGSRQSNKNTNTFTATTSIKVNGTSFSNIETDITGITKDLYLYGFKPSIREYKSSEKKLYIKSNYELRIGSSETKIIDFYDSSSQNYIDISDYVSGSSGTVITNTSVSRSATNYGPYQKYISGSMKWVIDTYPVINNDAYDTVSLDVQDLYDAWHQSGGITITSTDVNRVYSGNRPAEATTPDSGDTWYISVKPVVNNTEYDAVPLDVTDVYTKGYNANQGTVGAWEIHQRYNVSNSVLIDLDDVLSVTLEGDYIGYDSNSKQLYGYIELKHGSYYKDLWIDIDTSKVQTGGDTPSSGSYARTGQNFYVDEQSYDYGYDYNGSSSKVAITGYVEVDGHRVDVNSFDIGVGSVWWDGYQAGGGGSEGVTIIDANGNSRTYSGGTVYISEIVKSSTQYGTTYAYQWGANGETPYVVSRYA